MLLENKKDILPLVARGKRVFLHGVDSATAARYGFTVAPDLAHADIAIVRTNAPFQTLHPNYAFGARFHEGDLGFRAGDKEFEEIKRITAAVPTIVTVYLDRPAILSELKDRASALIGNFGVSDARASRCVDRESRSRKASSRSSCRRRCRRWRRRSLLSPRHRASALPNRIRPPVLTASCPHSIVESE